MNSLARRFLHQKVYKRLNAGSTLTNVTAKPGILGLISSSYECINDQPSRNAGHSKWANIKHTKMAKDMEKSKEATKYGSMIRIAVREGGGNADPKTNSKLAQVITQIKDAKLSMSSFEKLIQNLQAKKEHKSQILPIKGPGSCVLLVEISSDSIARSKQELQTILRKNKGLIVEDSALHLFEQKGLIYCNRKENKLASEENLEDTIADAIEAGADDVVYISDHPEFGSVYEFSTSPSAFFRVKHALENIKYDVVHGDVDFIPKIEVELADTDIQDAHKLYDKLSSHPDVAKISANIG